MDWLQEAAHEQVKVDIVYLDPMFPASKHKSALPKRRMQWLREYLGPSAAATPQAEQEELQFLFEAAKRIAKKVDKEQERQEACLLLKLCAGSH
eukprot:754682-Hanusia_phi.AAC.2